MFQTSKLMSLDISIVCPCPCSVFHFDVKMLFGMVAWFPYTSDFLRWPSYAVFLLTLIKPQEIVWSDLNTSPVYCSHIWLCPDLPYMGGIMFILWVGVVYPCSLYHI